MKTKIAINLVLVVAMFGFAGCKPKETTLSGQMFIVTQGADNVKFGDVEVALIDRPQVIEFLQKRSSGVEAEMKKREQAVEAAETNSQKVSHDVEIFVDSQVYATNANYIQIKGQLDESLKMKKTLAEQRSALKKAKENLSSTMTTNTSLADLEAISSKAIEISHQEDSVVWQNVTNDSIVERLQFELENIKNDAESVQQTKVDEAKWTFTTAQTHAANFPTIGDYLANFTPTVFQKTLTDADGKFSFTYPRDKSFALFASAERKIPNGTEKYYWLVDAPVNSEQAQIFLSNKNLVYVDPDGYFKIKPKEGVQELSNVSSQ